MRPSQALRLWQQVALSEVHADKLDLSMRQAAILLTVYLDPPPHTVRGLGRATWGQQAGYHPGARHNGSA